MDSGGFVSDDILIGRVRDRLLQPDCKDGYLFDGFPRTIPQADALKNANVSLDFVVEIVVPEENIIERMSGRRVHPASGRSYHTKFNPPRTPDQDDISSEEHTSELQSLMRNSYAVYCLKKKTKHTSS